MRTGGAPVTLPDRALVRMRDEMAYRGPDGAGLWRSDDGDVVLAHRRLAVVDLSPEAAQPFVSPDAKHTLVYNGELYNHAQVRSSLARQGVSFRTRCDTEIVLEAFTAWGPSALARLRGMFALAWFDAAARRITLARDPLGIKPLYYAWRESAGAGTGELVFASSPAAILAHPDIPRRPDLTTVSAYLSTIRTTLERRTMFAGISTLLPGEMLSLELRSRDARPLLTRTADNQTASETPAIAGECSDLSSASVRTRELLRDSVRLHLHADVPVCSLLSGGLDSSIIAAEATAAGAGSALRTYCAGHDDGDDASDLACARRLCDHLGTTHTEALVTRELFAERWGEMVARLGVPLSTPNEIAINEVGRRLRADGQVVALSGEGADELFGGYDLVLSQSESFEAARAAGKTSVHPGHFQLLVTSWVPPDHKGSVLAPDVWRGLERDAHLLDAYAAAFDAGAALSTDSMSAHMRFLQRTNLTGLLGRLDTALMLEGVEGRTPFADAHVAAFANALHVGLKFASATPTAPPQTKRVLRAAYADHPSVPDWVIARPKASFPLPFQSWIADQAAAVRQSSLVREVFRTDAVELVTRHSPEHWNLAWPMINLALWSRRWWA